MVDPTVITGAAGLARMIGSIDLVPSVVTVTKLLREIGDRNAQLDEAATGALRDLMVKTGEMSGDLGGVVAQSLEKGLNGAHERGHIAILEVFANVDRLNSVSDDAKAELMKQALEEAYATQRKEIEGHTELQKIVAVAGGGTLLVLAAAYGYKYARPKTFWEQVFALAR